jgi:hypothetical protein
MGSVLCTHDTLSYTASLSCDAKGGHGPWQELTTVTERPCVHNALGHTSAAEKRVCICTWERGSCRMPPVVRDLVGWSWLSDSKGECVCAAKRFTRVK